jgi:hypothetical protein
MSKNSILGLLIALGLPLGCYLWLKTASENAVNMPRKYLLDTVVTRLENGKEITDSIWHKTGNIRLVNQLGDTVSLYDKRSKIMVVDYILRAVEVFVQSLPIICKNSSILLSWEAMCAKKLILLLFNLFHSP